MPLNEVLGIDLVYYEKKIFLNMVCWGTNFQVVSQIPDRTSEATPKALMSEWFIHYRSPRLLVCDQGRSL